MTTTGLLGTSPGISRRAMSIAAATILLASGIAFSVKGGSGTTTYVEDRTEIITCTNTGGLAKYAYCNWQEPSNNAGSGSAIQRIYYTVGKSPVVLSLDFTVGKSATTSGTVITRFDNVQTSTGLTLTRSFTGDLLITEGDYLRLVNLRAPTTSHTATLLIDYTSRLSR